MTTLSHAAMYVSCLQPNSSERAVTPTHEENSVKFMLVGSRVLGLHDALASYYPMEMLCV